MQIWDKQDADERRQTRIDECCPRPISGNANSYDLKKRAEMLKHLDPPDPSSADTSLLFVPISRQISLQIRRRAGWLCWRCLRCQRDSDDLARLAVAVAAIAG